MRKAMFGLLLLAAFVFASAPLASAHPVTSSTPHFNACTHPGDIYAWGGYGLDAGDSSIAVEASMQWEADASGGYCGYIRPWMRMKEATCVGQGHEPIVSITTNLYTSGGTWESGYTQNFSPPNFISCDNWVPIAGNWAFVGCNINLHGWGSALEQYLAGGESDYGFSADADGADPGTYGDVHNICVN